jgi:NADH dehydrogenase [ubiquinone] 1 alpha subcomplex assembly factor 7
VTGLLDHLRRRIALEGPISVADYMALALGHPEHGYYMSRDPFGRAGDFVTAPEITQMFGELIGLWSAQVWHDIGKPQSIKWIELGPGRGTLCADALRAMKGVAGLADALEVHLVEISPLLRERQREALSALKPSWHDALAQVPPGPAVIVANEFFDALPVRQFERGKDGWHERLVAIDDAGRLAFTLSPRLAITPVLPAGLAEVRPGDVVEISPAAIGQMRTLADRLVRDGGAALVVDYGHARSAPGETLQALKGHAFADVLAEPGLADLTAHVDFQLLAETARATGAQVFGPLGQGELLRRLGIEIRAERLAANADAAGKAALQAALERLTGEDAMGRLFKAIAVMAPGMAGPAGFED